MLVTIVSLRCCATNFSQTSLLLMETLSSCIEMAESFGVYCVVKQSMDSPKRRKRSSRLYATHGRQKGFQYFRRFCFKYGAHVWEFLGLFYQSILDHKSGVNFHLLRCALAPLFNPSWCSQSRLRQGTLPSGLDKRWRFLGPGGSQNLARGGWSLER